MRVMFLSLISQPGEAAGAALTAALVVGGAVGWFLKKKMAESAAQAAAELENAKSAAAEKLAAEQQKAAQAALAAQGRFDGLSAQFADLEQRHQTLREASERRQNDAEQKIATLEADLSATREIAAQLGPTQARIKDLETALTAEQGRVRALDQAMSAQTARAGDLDRRLGEAQEFALRTKKDLEEREEELKRVIAEHEAFLAEGGLQSELNKANEAKVQSEAKVAQLQKSLSATEQRLALVQKEFMTAVGVPSAPVKAVSAAPAPVADKRVKELEEKIAQMEADARKKAREDGYRIAELEYKLGELNNS
jgi:hypothetical protein